jgi:hypothetical protein
VRWVATPPPGVTPPRRPRISYRYTGPPAYPYPPRWGFPNVLWRPPTAVPGTPSDVPVPLQRVRMIARNATALLWTVAALAAVAAGGEIWRYVLLALSRDSALDTSVVATSDALVLVGSLLAFTMGLFAVGAAVWWLFVTRHAAADEAGQRPGRSAWQVAVGTLVPGANLLLAGPILAELEHAVLRRAPDVRPRPSRLVLAWWAALAVNVVLVVLTFVWRIRDGVQAEADAVFLTALTDLSAVVLAALTASVIGRLTRLLAPIELGTVRRWRVHGVADAPEPVRPERPVTAAR